MTGRRYLRALWCVWVCLCFLPCVVVVVLWVRSHWWSDLARSHIGRWPIEIVSGDGRVKLTRVDSIFGQFDDFATYPSDQSEAQTINRHLRNYRTALGLGVVHRPDSAILFPYWFLAAVLFAIGILLTRRRWSGRFSLRSLLIATTLLAVLLGFIEWLWRS